MTILVTRDPILRVLSVSMNFQDFIMREMSNASTRTSIRSRAGNPMQEYRPQGLSTGD